MFSYLDFLLTHPHSLVEASNRTCKFTSGLPSAMPTPVQALLGHILPHLLPLFPPFSPSSISFISKDPAEQEYYCSHRTEHDCGEFERRFYPTSDDADPKTQWEDLEQWSIARRSECQTNPRASESAMPNNVIAARRPISKGYQLDFQMRHMRSPKMRVRRCGGNGEHEEWRYSAEAKMSSLCCTLSHDSAKTRTSVCANRPYTSLERKRG